MLSECCNKKAKINHTEHTEFQSNGNIAISMTPQNFELSPTEAGSRTIWVIVWCIRSPIGQYTALGYSSSQINLIGDDGDGGTDHNATCRQLTAITAKLNLKNCGTKKKIKKKIDANNVSLSIH